MAIHSSEVILRILYCSEDYSPHDHRFLTALGRSSHEIFWLRLKKSGRVQEERPIPQGVHSVKWRERWHSPSWLAYLKLKRDFRESVQDIRPDIIHAGPVQRVAFLPALTGCHPLLTMSWGYDLLQDATRNLFWRLITCFVLNRSDWLAVDCDTVKRQAETFGFPPGAITVFPWGVDLDHFTPDRRRFVQWQDGYEGDFLVVHTRSWEPRYGVDTALEGFRLAREEVPNLRMWMLGGGSQSQMVQEFIKKYHLEDCVHLCGYQKNQSLRNYYQAADAYLSASHIDGSSVALMEAMACGCPPIVSDIPSNLEWVTHGKEGWVFKDGNVGDLAVQIISAATQRTEAKTRGRAARLKAEEKADWRNNFQRLLATYDEIANRFSKYGKPMR